jgi:hypothetical protein
VLINFGGNLTHWTLDAQKAQTRVQEVEPGA